MSDIAIRIEHISKKYRLGVINNGTLFRDIQTWIALKQGKNDPHSKIGENKYANTENYFWALKDISLEIKQGDRIGIIGKNGAGKSTLLKLLSRITSPTEGSIKIKGKVASLLEVGTGFHGELTGRENIYLNGAILGMKKRRIDQKLDEIIAFSGIENHIDTPVKRYSSGMYVRLAFAVAAHLDSDILIADEVLAVGDAEFQNKAIGKMQDLSTGQGRTVLFVSHNMGAVEQLCNSGIILENGKVVFNSDYIKQVTKKYLGNDDNEKKFEWYNSGNEFDNPWFKPLAFYLTDANDNIINRNIESNHECWVNITGEIKEQDNALCIGYAIYNSDGVILYWSYQTDTEQEKWPNLKSGICKIRSAIPKHLFNEGEYRLELISSLHFRFWITEPILNAPEISLVIKGGLSDSPYWYSARPGVLAPIITWK
ncbi:ABC transporter, ATP-binding protein [Treponema primitia ZAS-2]|uniref:ABC transporter, ATP-binding protein n=1 Tax=Treponema primitia (strain ATCC BAA-887 / DSM 12427 / ZAS-2) TaxID=545694 RepID=F5YHK8_TREPZ|nr:ABC transporter ATP-binding protein [Treponema primitia]AEF86261.1 ABC transporter, ATP-binding protein [Treponema primitia ZAS-2]